MNLGFVIVTWIIELVMIAHALQFLLRELRGVKRELEDFLVRKLA